MRNRFEIIEALHSLVDNALDQFEAGMAIDLGDEYENLASWLLGWNDE